MKACLAVAVCVAVASTDVMHDDGLSLLQMRTQPHKDVQEPKYYKGTTGGDCAPEEDLSFAQCIEAQVKKIIPNNMAAHGLVYNQRSGGFQQTACYIASNGQMYFSDEPKGGRIWPGRGAITPICSKNGGFQKSIAEGQMSCKEADCQHKPSMQLNWGEGGSVVVPEFQILAAGAICEPCGILSYAQCSKAGDTGLVVYGGVTVNSVAHQCSGGGHTRPAMPSGCSVHVSPSTQMNFCSYDTPDGALAGLVSDSGAGVGFGKVRPVCGVCTTTTTTPEPPAADVGGEADGECPAGQEVGYVEGRADNAEYRRDAQRKMVTFDTEDGAQAVCNADDTCLAIWFNAKACLALYPGGRSWAKGVPNGSVKSVKLKSCVDIPVDEDEAAAVGDPHLVTNKGKHFDYRAHM